MGNGPRVEVGGLVCRLELCRIRTSFSFVLGGMGGMGWICFVHCFTFSYVSHFIFISTG